MKEKYSPVTVYVNPKDGPAVSGLSYPILTDKNKILHTSYNGRTNYAGNRLRTMAARSATELNKVYDAMKIKTRTYLYLTTNVESENDDVADTMRGNMIRSIKDIMSKLFNETFRELDFFKISVNGLTTNDQYSAVRDFNVLYDYQSYLQNILLVINAYNRFISMESILKDMGYGNESLLLNELYSLTKRNTLKGKVDSIANTLLQEYVDWD